MIDSLIGPYRVTKKIGQGGMGAVYEAVHQTIERRVAIKVLKPELAKIPTLSVRFINEARAVNLVNHPGIVQISDYGQLEDGSAYIVMELLEGETLGRRLVRQGGRLQVGEILRLVRQITSALAAAHQKNIIHRDLKPDNVMLVQETSDDDGTRERVKLLDFGIAKVSSAPQGVDHEKTLPDTVLGSPEYMSPEQCKGMTDITDKADIYSLGVIMYRLLCGQLPFPTTAGSASLLAAHVFEPPPPLPTLVPDIPEPIANLVHRMLGKTAEERPSAQQVFGFTEQLAGMLGMTLSSPVVSPRRSDLSALVQADGARNSSPPGSATGQSGSKEPPPPGRARLGGALAALLLISAGATVFILRSPGRAPASRRTVSAPTGKSPGEATAAVKGAVAKETADADEKLRPMWTVQSEPPGAQVVRDADGVVLGVTPWHGEQPADKAPIAVHLRLAGYSERALTLQPGADVLYSPTLSRKSKGGKSHGPSKDQPDVKDPSIHEPPKPKTTHEPEIAD